MADKVNVGDVLLEAINYLWKLGHNLKIQTANCKEKKMRHGVKTYHAAKKVANKILLICDLSKKSLDIVEKAVQDLLLQMDKSKASSCRIPSPSSNVNAQYEYFEHDSKKLKIRNKISLKHFTSVKVSVKPIPGEIFKKYLSCYGSKRFEMQNDKNTQLHPVEKYEKGVKKSDIDKEILWQQSKKDSVKSPIITETVDSQINEHKKSVNDQIDNSSDLSKNMETEAMAPKNDSVNFPKSTESDDREIKEHKKSVNIINDDSSNKSKNIETQDVAKGTERVQKVKQNKDSTENKEKNEESGDEQSHRQGEYTKKTVEDSDKDMSSNDSSDEKLSRKRKRKRERTSLKSKNNTTKDYMHVKKMLLTDSSSSDKEDEPPKDNLKKIIESLLEDSNSSD